MHQVINTTGAGLLAGLLVMLLSARPCCAQPAEKLLQGIALFRQGMTQWDAATLAQAGDAFSAVEQQAAEPVPSLRYWQAVTAFQRVLNLDGQPASPARDQARSAAMQKAVDLLEQALDDHFCQGECQAMRAVLTGIRIGDNPLSGIWRGPRIKADMAQALELEPDNPRVHYLVGTGYYYAPGGQVETALHHLRRAEKLYQREMQQSHQPTYPAWGYDHCLLFLGMTRRRQGHDSDAVRYFRKTLSVNPQNQRAAKALREMTDDPS